VLGGGGNLKNPRIIECIFFEVKEVGFPKKKGFFMTLKDFLSSSGEGIISVSWSRPGDNQGRVHSGYERIEKRQRQMEMPL